MDGFVFNRRQIREVDRRAIEHYGMSGLVLMENAGRGAADELCAAGASSSVVICCGHGNNGGDGLVMARHLDLRRRETLVLMFPPGGALADADRQWETVDWLSPDAAANFRILRHAGVSMEVLPTSAALPQLLARADWIVDALLGTGSRGEPRAPLGDVIAAINASGKRVLALDLPSGLDCDTGQAAANTIRATMTYTFAALKPGLIAPGAERYTGVVKVLSIGAPRKLMEEIAAEGPN